MRIKNKRVSSMQRVLNLLRYVALRNTCGGRNCNLCNCKLDLLLIIFYELFGYAGIVMQRDVVEGMAYTKQVNDLKEDVKKDMLTTFSSNDNMLEKIYLVDSICKLGVSYHFEGEIENVLCQMFHIQDHHLLSYDDNAYDLYAVALIFRVFRQHDVSNKFKGNDGKQKATLANVANAMLSLYEASHLSFHGEDILDEALSFSKSWLESLVKSQTISPHLRQHIMNALEQTYHRGIPRIEARNYISFYQHQDCHNEKLLKFAKLDFNRVQLLHQQELKFLSRIVELYSWAVSMLYGPHYAQARRTFTQMMMMCVIVDDTYDAYGTYEELQQFSKAIERWNIDALDLLPDYLKIFYQALLDLFDEFDEEMTKEGRSFSVSYAKDLIIEVSNSYFVEAGWFDKGYVPPLEEYMSNAIISVNGQALAGSCFVGMGEVAGVEAFEWLKTKPKLLTSVSILGRLIDDIMSCKGEQARGHVASAVECCMKQYGVSEKEVIGDLKKRVANEWKTVNEECLRPFPVSMHLLQRVVNIARIVDTMYKYGDAFTEPEYITTRNKISNFNILCICLPKSRQEFGEAPFKKPLAFCDGFVDHMDLPPNPLIERGAPISMRILEYFCYVSYEVETGHGSIVKISAKRNAVAVESSLSMLAADSVSEYH
ncbi:probable terpene synthase 6 [Tripterygium wilfordii]|uniref:probable terpene synthase 6 n=1 Tax=Tripterygium wilfordii TaxID=458696 RepID=UPI0018F84D45|nr:probable terpene synthase 6 [Tripterygium wilfordii]